MRKRLAALRSPRFSLVDTGPESALVYLRPRENGSEPVLVVMNWAASPQAVQVKPPPGFRGALQDELSGEPVPVQSGPDGLTLDLPAWGVRVLTPAK
ncbi:alpha-glucosidase C-terminal domain-containing protein [Myxococcus sp. RHST-1-4]|nr:alpha-glucosidase C-terminal domain-containing protein [Myxococcus sp. RHSTA-1-4]